MKKVILSFLQTAFVFGFAGWAYIAMNAVFHPYTLAMPLTHLLPFPREDTFGAGCFLVSAIAFFLWKVFKDSP